MWLFAVHINWLILRQLRYLIFTKFMQLHSKEFGSFMCSQVLIIIVNNFVRFVLIDESFNHIIKIFFLIFTLQKGFGLDFTEATELCFYIQFLTNIAIQVISHFYLAIQVHLSIKSLFWSLGIYLWFNFFQEISLVLNIDLFICLNVIF